LPSAFRQLLENRLIGLRGEHVRRQLHDRIVVEWAEDDRARAVSLQLFERVDERRRFARGAKGDDPGDRQSHESHRQRANRGSRPPSAQWASSIEIRSGDSSAARSSSCCRSRSNQNVARAAHEEW
jgi:hypothetical protein